MAESVAEDRLTLEELNFMPALDAPIDHDEWHRHFPVLMAEYQTALESGDEGWITGLVAEVRKRLSTLRNDALAGTADGCLIASTQERHGVQRT